VQTNPLCTPSGCPTLLVIIINWIWTWIPGVLANWSRYGNAA
jgi:hypothetical protein